MNYRIRKLERSLGECREATPLNALLALLFVVGALRDAGAWAWIPVAWFASETLRHAWGWWLFRRSIHDYDEAEWDGDYSEAYSYDPDRAARAADILVGALSAEEPARSEEIRRRVDEVVRILNGEDEVAR